MFCSKCGAAVEDEAKYCPKCGAALSGISGNMSAPIQASAREKSSRQKKLLIGAATVLAVAGIIVLAVYIINPKNQSGSGIEEKIQVEEETSQETIVSSEENSQVPEESSASYEEASEGLSEDTADEADEEKVYLETAESLYQEGRYDEAMGYYETLKGMNPELAEIYLGEADIYLQSDNVAAALDVLEEGKAFASENVLIEREAYIKEHTVAYLIRVADPEGWRCEYEYAESGNLVKEIRYYYDTDSYTEFEYDTNGNEIKVTNYDEDGSAESWSEQEYDARGNLIKSRSYGEYGSSWSWSEWEYDENGNEIKYTNYDEDGSAESWSEWEYDERGNLIKELRGNGDGSVYTWRENEYDTEGNLIKWTDYNGDGSVYTWGENEYDTEGNLIKWIDYNGDGSIASMSEKQYNVEGKLIKEIRNNSIWGEYVYDAEGNLIKEIAYREDSDDVLSWREYAYDMEGKLIKETEHYGDGSISWWTEYEYNTGGNLIKETDYFEDGSIMAWREYDAGGNLIKDICYGMYGYGYEYSLSGIKLVDGEYMWANLFFDFLGTDGSCCMRKVELDDSGNVEKVLYESEVVYHFSE